MTDSEFERPGAPPRPAPDHWPYHAPPAEEPTPPVLFEDVADPDPTPSAPTTRRLRLLVAVTVGLVVGALAGVIWGATASRGPPEPQPVPIALDTFPRELLGAPRNDLALREAGFGPTVERLDAEFAEQLAGFRFAYGGAGATFGYGRSLNLTIVNGVLPPPLPRDSAVNRDGRVTQTRRLVSLRTDDVSCTFEPKPVFNRQTGLEEPGDLSSDGLTDCVLVDHAHNLSLRLSQDEVPRGADAIDTSDTFRRELERLHRSLVG